MEGITPRGVRNFNPGNIVRNNISWLGLADQQTDDTFWQFSTAEYGIRAIAHILRSYKRDGIVTIHDAIYRWSATDQAAYAANVAQACGIDEGHIVDLETLLFPIVKAICHQENGGDFYTDDQITEGINLP